MFTTTTEQQKKTGNQEWVSKAEPYLQALEKRILDLRLVLASLSDSPDR